MTEVPELVPTRWEGDLQENFISTWQAPLASATAAAQRLSTHLFLAHSLGRHTNNEITERLSPIDTKRPNHLAKQVQDTTEKMSAAGLVIAHEDTAGRNQGFEATDELRDSLGLLGALGVWQLTHAYPLSQTTGDAHGQPYHDTPTLRLQILQLAARGPVVTDDVLAFTGKTYNPDRVQGLFLDLTRVDLLRGSERRWFLDRQITLTEPVNPRKNRATQHETSQRLALFEAGRTLYEQGVQETSVRAIIAEALRHHPNAKTKLLGHCLRYDSPPFIHLKPPQTQGYYLNPEATGVLDLLLSICSLQDAEYSEKAVRAAGIIAEDPQLLPELARSRPRLKLPQGSVQNQPRMSSIPEWLRQKVEGNTIKGRQRRERLRELDFLFTHRILEGSIAASTADPSVKFSSPMASICSQAELKAFAHILGLERLMFGSSTHSLDLAASLGLPDNRNFLQHVQQMFRLRQRQIKITPARGPATEERPGIA